MGRPRKLLPELYWMESEGVWAANFRSRRRRYGAERGPAEAAFRKDCAAYIEGGALPSAPVPETPARTVAQACQHYAKCYAGQVSAKQRDHYLRVLEVVTARHGSLPADAFGAAHVRDVKEHLLRTPFAPPEGACVALLRGLFRERNPRPAGELERAARKAGHSRSVYQAARKVLGVVAHRRPDNTWSCRADPSRLLPPGPRPLSRGHVNRLLGLLRTVWRRLASDGLVPAEKAAEVAGVLNVPHGGGGRETAPRQPASAAVVEGVLPHLPRVAGALVRFQQLTGCRPAEACGLLRCEVSTSPGEKVPVVVGSGSGRVAVEVAAVVVGTQTVWACAPGAHKGRRRGKPRLFALGASAREVLAPLLEGLAPGDIVFSPDARRKKSRTPYTPASYAQALKRACARAGVPAFTPYQLRHLYATASAQEGDLADLQAQLGHSAQAMTGHYVAQMLERAARLAARQG